MSNMKIVTAAEMRCLEDESVRFGVSTEQLMENAGLAVAQSVRRILGTVAGKRIIVLIGPGNNGGDGLVAARCLSDWGVLVHVFLAGARSEDDDNLKSVRERGIVVTSQNLSELGSLLKGADAVLDAIFGTGQNRGIGGIYKDVLEKLAETKQCHPSVKVFAVDLPSGLDSDTGKPDPATPFVDHTLVLGLSKRGLYVPEGAARAGEVVLLDIGLPLHLTAGLGTELLTAELVRTLLPLRSPYAHKGSNGKVLVVAGSASYIGAAYLACAGAARAGAGLVALAAPMSIIPAVAAGIPEIIYLPLPEIEELAKSADRYDAVLIGPGLGQKRAEALLGQIVFGALPKHLILDADALNALSQMGEWWKHLADDAVLTPHPGEMGRLTGLAADEVQAGRIALAREKAALWGKTVVLKGAFSVIAAPDGRCRVSPFANAAMASAGTGDVLAGVVAGLLGQGLPLFDAASLGVYLHARAGERAKTLIGEIGMLASDLLPELPRAIQELRDAR